jgi:4-amino-4-deoxy-L-arabinose transferase-like glycosyltransferase
MAALFVLLYCAAHAAITLATGAALALDDVKLNVLAQSWRLGYLPDNPPLFEWTLILAQRVLGPTLASFVAVKYFFLIAAAAFAYLALREAGADRRTAAAGPLLTPLIPQIGFAYHHTLTHSAALLAATAFFWFALLRTARRGHASDFALLGVAIGLGALSKYAFVPAAIVALGAALLRPAMRRSLLRPQLALTFAIAALLASPHLLWLAENYERAAALFQQRLIGSAAYWARVGEGLAGAAWAIAVFFAPMLAVLFAADRRSFRALWSRRDSLLFDSAAGACVFILAAAATLGLSNFQERYALAFLFPGFLWLIAGSAKVNDAPQLSSALLIASAALSLGAAAIRAAEAAFPGRPFCTDCRQHIPYDHLRRALAEKAGANDTLVAFDDDTAGNLRRLFPRMRVISALHIDVTPPVRARGDCQFIWSTDLSPPPSQSALDQLDSRRFAHAGGPWRRRMNGEKELRSTWWTITKIERSAPMHAVLCRS